MREEIKRLRSVNADLLAVVEMVAAGNTEFEGLEAAARAAIAKAKGKD